MSSSNSVLPIDKSSLLSVVCIRVGGKFIDLKLSVMYVIILAISEEMVALASNMHNDKNLHILYRTVIVVHKRGEASHTRSNI